MKINEQIILKNKTFNKNDLNIKNVITISLIQIKNNIIKTENKLVPLNINVNNINNDNTSKNKNNSKNGNGNTKNNQTNININNNNIILKKVEKESIIKRYTLLHYKDSKNIIPKNNKSRHLENMKNTNIKAKKTINKI